MRYSERKRALHVAEIGMDLVAQRDMVNLIAMESPPNAFLAYDSLRCFLDEPEKYGGICGDMQLFASQLFTAYGIDSRAVSMFDNVNGVNGTINGHAANDIKIDGKWSGVDLTFGFYFEDWLSWREAREKMLAGETVNTVKIGNGRVDLENYYITIPELIQFMAISPPSPGTKVNILCSKDKVRWDGNLRENRDSPPMYMAQSMLRREELMREKFSAPREIID